LIHTDKKQKWEKAPKKKGNLYEKKAALSRERGNSLCFFHPCISEFIRGSLFFSVLSVSPWWISCTLLVRHV